MAQFFFLFHGTWCANIERPDVHMFFFKIFKQFNAFFNNGCICTYVPKLISNLKVFCNILVSQKFIMCNPVARLLARLGSRIGVSNLLVGGTNVCWLIKHWLLAKKTHARDVHYTIIKCTFISQIDDVFKFGHILTFKSLTIYVFWISRLRTCISNALICLKNCIHTFLCFIHISYDKKYSKLYVGHHVIVQKVIYL
jgi:hypothetical protein